MNIREGILAERENALALIDRAQVSRPTLAIEQRAHHAVKEGSAGTDQDQRTRTLAGKVAADDFQNAVLRLEPHDHEVVPLGFEPELTNVVTDRVGQLSPVRDVFRIDSVCFFVVTLDAPRIGDQAIRRQSDDAFAEAKILLHRPRPLAALPLETIGVDDQRRTEKAGDKEERARTIPKHQDRVEGAHRSDEKTHAIIQQAPNPARRMPDSAQCDPSVERLSVGLIVGAKDRDRPPLFQEACGDLLRRDLERAVLRRDAPRPKNRQPCHRRVTADSVS